jgi:hypothetical protein
MYPKHARQMIKLPYLLPLVFFRHAGPESKTWASASFVAMIFGKVLVSETLTDREAVVCRFCSAHVSMFRGFENVRSDCVYTSVRGGRFARTTHCFVSGLVVKVSNDDSGQHEVGTSIWSLCSPETSLLQADFFVFGMFRMVSKKEASQTEGPSPPDQPSPSQKFLFSSEIFQQSPHARGTEPRNPPTRSRRNQTD